MRTPLLLVALLPLLVGCASVTADRQPVCAGHARRPANPHGTVLQPTAPATPEFGHSSELPTGGATGGCA